MTANTFFADVGINAMLDGIAGTWLSLHSATPGTTGAAEITGGSYARLQTAWNAAATSAKTGSQKTINVPAGVTITHFGIWSAVSGVTYQGGGVLPATEVYGSAGTYLITPTVAGSG